MSTAAIQIMDERQAALVDLAKNAVAAYEAWSSGDDGFVEQDSALDDAIVVTVAAFATGDIPERCRELSTAVGKLGVEYDHYIAGKFVPVTAEPLDAFYRAWQAVVEALAGSEPYLPPERESPKQFQQQDVLPEGIAKAYGVRDPVSGLWHGIFFGPRGTVLVEKIQAEIDKPGSILKDDYVHPEDIAIRARHDDELKTRLERIAERQRDAQSSSVILDENEILYYIGVEGGYVHQSAKQYGVSEETIIEILERGGVAIPPYDPDTPTFSGENPTGEETTPDPPTTDQADDPPKSSVEVVTDADPSVSQSTIKDAIRELAQLEIPATTIAAQLTTQFKVEVTTKRCAAMIREVQKKKRSEAAAPPPEQAAEDAVMDKQNT